MKLSRPCHTAAHSGVVLTLEGEQRMHAHCPGAAVFDTRTIKCECGCHPDHWTVEDAIRLSAGDPLPVAVAVSGAGPGAARKDLPAPRRAATGRCECGCGRSTGGRFAPGHDAKLKSRLWKEAKAGDHKAFAELLLRRWVKPEDGLPADLPFEVETRGEEFAKQMPHLVERRTRWRQEHPCR